MLRHPARMLHEKAQHLPCGVGPTRIGVGPGEAAAGPGVAGAVDDPLLENRAPVLFGVHGAAVSIASAAPALLHLCGQWRGLR